VCIWERVGEKERWSIQGGKAGGWEGRGWKGGGVRKAPTTVHLKYFFESSGEARGQGGWRGKERRMIERAREKVGGYVSIGEREEGPDRIELEREV